MSTEQKQRDELDELGLPPKKWVSEINPAWSRWVERAAVVICIERDRGEGTHGPIPCPSCLRAAEALAEARS